MKQNAKVKISVLIVFVILVFPFTISQYSSANMNSELDNVKTLDQLLEKRKRYFTPTSSYAPDRIINILIVPGHDDEYSGAVFNGIKEVEFNREVSKKLYEYLSLEPGINPILAHEKNEYNSFLNYSFQTYRKEIEKFIEDSVDNFSEKKKDEELEIVDPGFHNVALPEIRYRLYGINWWANQNDIDLVMHIHFNDYRGRTSSEKPKYDGFSIYIPGENFDNHGLSKVLGQSVFEELKKIRPISNLPFEEEGIIGGHELIAVGSNNSLKAGSVLLEYGYMYEDLFQDESTKDVTFDYLAYTTYVGVKKMFGESAFEKQVTLSPTASNKTTKNNLIWQFEKSLKGIYPPEDKTLRECPITGYFGECSRMVR